MPYTREEVIPSLIPNTTMYKNLRDGMQHTTYAIAPVEGYVLHDKNRDWYGFDPITGELNAEPTLGFTTGTTTCPADYDFTVNPREFYAVPEDSVPADQIFGGGGNDHKVM